MTFTNDLTVFAEAEAAWFRLLPRKNPMQYRDPSCNSALAYGFLCCAFNATTHACGSMQARFLDFGVVQNPTL